MSPYFAIVLASCPEPFNYWTEDPAVTLNEVKGLKFYGPADVGFGQGFEILRCSQNNMEGEGCGFRPSPE